MSFVPTFCLQLCYTFVSFKQLSFQSFLLPFTHLQLISQLREDPALLHSIHPFFTLTKNRNWGRMKKIDRSEMMPCLTHLALIVAMYIRHSCVDVGNLLQCFLQLKLNATVFAIHLHHVLPMALCLLHQHLMKQHKPNPSSIYQQIFFSLSNETDKT